MKDNILENKDNKTGNKTEEHVITCNNLPQIDMTRLDGGLEHMAGVYTYQVRRSCRSDGDYTYNHAPMLTGFNNHLILAYISGLRDEHGVPDKIVYTVSADGKTWEREKDMFPYMLLSTEGYTGPDKNLLEKKAPAVVHFRMCFYKASNGKMLATAFYGFSPDFHRAPNNGYGAARLVREVYSDFSLSPMYVIKYNTAGGFTESNTQFYRAEDGSREEIPYYINSEAAGFAAACDELLNNKLITQQWYEEEMYDEQYYVKSRALSLYTAADGKIIGLCKKGEGYVFDSNGNIELFEKVPTLITNTAKVWGQKTYDGDYIICYNPTTDGSHRWPLAVMYSSDGRRFDDMKALVPEFPPYRYQGNIKNLGVQYMRGICEYNEPFDENVWITYSCNKEDIWISSITKDKRYSVISPLWGIVEKIQSDKNGDVWQVVDKDACERAVIEYFPVQDKLCEDKCSSIDNKTYEIEIDIKRISDDNGVKAVFFGRNNKELMSTVCRSGVNHITYSADKAEVVRIAVYSKEKLDFNTIDDDGRNSTLPDMKDAERKDFNTEYTVRF